MTWQTVKLQQIAATGTGGTPPRDEGSRYFGGTIPWIKSGELKDSLITEASETITEEALAESNAKLVPPGAVLIALYGATVGKTALLGFEAATNQAVCYIIPDRRMAEPKYIWFAFRAKLHELLAKRVGGAQPNISLQIIRSTEIPIPALREQHRIVELLEEADSLRRQQIKADKLADRVVPALFQTMFGDPATNPKNWPRLNLGNITSITAEMIDPRRAEYLDLPHVGPDRIESRSGRLLNCKTAREEGLISGKYLFDCSHVLYSKIRPYLQKVALPDFSGLCSADMYPVTPHPKWITREFLWALLLSPAFTNYTTEHSGRANMPKLNREQFAAYNCPVPPLALQRKFSELVLKLRRLEDERETAADHLAKVFDTMLHRAFTGQLTAKWREKQTNELQIELQRQTQLINTASVQP